VCCVAAAWSSQRGWASLPDNLVINNAIGLSQYSLAMLVRVFFHGRLPVLGIVAAIPLGFVIGSKIASLLGTVDPAALMLADPVAMRQVIVDSTAIGIVVTAFFLYFSYSRGVAVALERERRRAAEALQGETAARLALLQAQIEPHFLFNTLANIHALIKQDADAASRILEELNSYLRASLRRSRQMTATVAGEVELVEALLALAAARLGARLTYEISLPAELRATTLPPLLLQPLVENAIRHGIEPAIDGGKIVVDVRRTASGLELTVTDTGSGLNANAPEGVGLSNVRARLVSLYGADGKLQLYANAPRGVIAKLIVP
jgi:signal transduction histidine kinase